ncbi:hypothetical protein D3C83_71310 [compost metagenome]
MFAGRAPGCRPPRRESAFTIGCGEPSRLAEAASARNSRWRENQATIIEANSPSTIWETMTVTKKPMPWPRSFLRITRSTM